MFYIYVMNSSFLVSCDRCGTKNRIPAHRQAERGICGKCHAQLPSVQSMSNKPVSVSDRNFTSEVTSFPGPVLVEFTAPWWGYCRTQAPVLDELASRYAGKIKFASVDVDTSPETASRHNIRGVPAIYFYNRGNIIDKAVGALSKGEIERRIQNVVSWYPAISKAYWYRAILSAKVSTDTKQWFLKSLFRVFITLFRCLHYVPNLFGRQLLFCFSTASFNLFQRYIHLKVPFKKRTIDMAPSE